MNQFFFATPWGFKIFQPIKYNDKLDPNILYSFHIYESYSFTGRHNKDKYKYLGVCPIGENGNHILYF